MWHTRLAPAVHRFSYRIFLFAIDLDELDEIGRGPLFSVERFNLYSFRDRDFFPSDESQHLPASPEREPGRLPSSASLKSRVVDYLANRNVDLSGGRVILITLPRILGALFNPVSFYFCYDRRGSVVASIAEVTNTFRERKLYFLGPETRSAGGTDSETFRLRVPKFFYVSPFSDVDVEFDFRLRKPNDRIAVQIDDFTAGSRTFTSSLQGSRRNLTSARLAWYALKYPALSVQILARIHWHALRLWLKKNPWFAKAARASEQREVFRAHDSLTRPDPGQAASFVPAAAEVETLNVFAPNKSS
jgi:DUF1365 family protein